MDGISLESSFREWCEEYIHEREVNEKNNKSWYVRRKQNEKHLYPLIGNRSFNSLEYTDYVSALGKIKKQGYADGTIVAYWTTIRQVTIKAVKLGLIDRPALLDITAQEMLKDIAKCIESQVVEEPSDEQLPDPAIIKNIVITKRTSVLVYLIHLYNENDNRDHHKTTWAVIKVIYEFITKDVLNKSLVEVDQYDVRRICHDIMDSRYSDEYVRVILRFVRFAFINAFETGLMESSFETAFRIPKVSRRTEFHFSDDEYERIKTEMNKSNLINLYTLVETIGIVRSEVLALQAHLYDRVTGTLIIGDCANTRSWTEYDIIPAEKRTKYKKRTIVLPEKAVKALDDELVRREAKRQLAGDRWDWSHDYIFTDHIGKLISTDALFFDVERIRCHSGVASFDLSTLRKHSIYRMIKNDISVIDVKDYLGFKSLDSILALYDTTTQNEQWREGVV